MALTPTSVTVVDKSITINLPTVDGGNRYKVTVVSHSNFSAQHTIHLNTPNPTDAAVGDVNNDGSPDIVVSNSNGMDPTVFLGNGAGDFDAGHGFPWPAGAVTTLILSDFNMDGK